MSETTEEERQEPQEESSPKQQELPGKHLKEAREAAGLSRSELAMQMRINERMVAALEEDDYEVFPSATFVSGYLRSYARVLGLPDDKFAKPVSNSIEPPSLVSTIGSDEQVTSRDLPVRLVTYLLVAAVFVSVGMWWFSGHDGNDTFTVGPEDHVTASTGDATLSLPEEGTTDSRDGMGSVLAPAADSGTAETAPDSATADSTTETDEASSSAASEDTTSAMTPAAESQPAVKQTKTVAESSKASTNKTAPPPITAATPVSQLELRYQADSWTEIRDSAGRNLAYGLIKAGQTLQLKGQAPFRVFLGYAPGVSVYYNGELFDHSPFQRRNVARFRVGRAEHNVPGSR